MKDEEEERASNMPSHCRSSEMRDIWAYPRSQTRKTAKSFGG